MRLEKPLMLLVILILCVLFVVLRDCGKTDPDAEKEATDVTVTSLIIPVN